MHIALCYKYLICAVVIGATEEDTFASIVKFCSTCFVVKETGDYLALDLGGTNFRVLLISLHGKNVDMKNKIYPIAEDLMLGSGTQVT